MRKVKFCQKFVKFRKVSPKFCTMRTAEDHKQQNYVSSSISWLAPNIHSIEKKMIYRFNEPVCYKMLAAENITPIIVLVFTLYIITIRSVFVIFNVSTLGQVWACKLVPEKNSIQRFQKKITNAVLYMINMFDFVKLLTFEYRLVYF